MTEHTHTTKKSLETALEYWQEKWISLRSTHPYRYDRRNIIYRMWPDEAGIITPRPYAVQELPIIDLAELLVAHLLDVHNLHGNMVNLLPVDDNGDVPYTDVVDHALDIHALIYGETLTPYQEETIHEVIEQAVVLIDTECQAICTAARIKRAKLADKFND